MKQQHLCKLAFFIMLALAISPAWAQLPQPFSADYKTVTAHGPTVIGKWYFSPPKMRIDITSGAQASPMGNISMIIDGSTQVTDMLMPQQQMYMEMKGNSGRADMEGMNNLKQMATTGGACPQNATCKQLGTEVVNGRSTDKIQITDAKGSSTVWMDQKLHFPIRILDRDGAQSDFTNVQEGAQDASLFKVPAGYKPFDPAAFSRQRK